MQKKKKKSKRKAEYSVESKGKSRFYCILVHPALMRPPSLSAHLSPAGLAAQGPSVIFLCAPACICACSMCVCVVCLERSDSRCVIFKRSSQRHAGQEVGIHLFIFLFSFRLLFCLLPERRQEVATKHPNTRRIPTWRFFVSDSLPPLLEGD